MCVRLLFSVWRFCSYIRTNPRQENIGECHNLFQNSLSDKVISLIKNGWWTRPIVLSDVRERLCGDMRVGWSEGGEENENALEGSWVQKTNPYKQKSACGSIFLICFSLLLLNWITLCHKSSTTTLSSEVRRRTKSHHSRDHQWTQDSL